MSKDIWFISDTHFGHANFLKFEKEDETKIRPFNSTQEMDEYMVQKWNEVVKDGDKVYHLGDVVMNAKHCTRYLGRLRGSKRLCIGNHDLLERNSQYYTEFKKITLWRLFKEHGFICTHVPLKKSSMRHAKVNVHGHIHERKMKSPIYFNACVEHHDYTPISIDLIKDHVKMVEQLDWDNLSDDSPQDVFHNA